MYEKVTVANPMVTLGPMLLGYRDQVGRVIRRENDITYVRFDDGKELRFLPGELQTCRPAQT